MTTLSDLTSETKDTKPWLTIVAASLSAQTVTADNIVGPVSGGSLTLSDTGSVANPAAGHLTLFSNLSGQVSTTNPLGDTITLLDNPASQNQDMNGHNVSGLASESYSGDVIINKGAGNANIALGANINPGSTSSIAIGGFASTVSGSNNIGIGSQLGIGGGGTQYVIGIGEAITANGFASVSLGGGNSGIINHQSHSVALGNDMTLAAADGGICLGNAAGLGGVNNAIAVGSGAVNNVASSALIGDAAIANIRSNNSTHACDLGTSAAPFKTCWLRDASPAAGSKFSMYAPVTVSNTVAETPLLTGTSVGSLVYSAGQSLGAVIRFKMGTSITVGVADTVVVRLKINGVTAVSQTLGGAVFAAVPGAISCDCVIQAANIMCELNAFQDGGGSNITLASPAYNPAVANTFSFTAQWSAASAGDSLSANYCYVESLFAQ
jgi:hypothetical protein